VVACGGRRKRGTEGLEVSRTRADMWHGDVSSGQHRYPLAVCRVPRDRRLDVDGAGGEMPPGEGRVAALHLALLDQPREPVVRARSPRRATAPRYRGLARARAPDALASRPREAPCPAPPE